MKPSLSLAAVLLALTALSQSAQAQTAITPKAQFTADSKAAAARYASDKALCNDETSSNARLQCRRDAKAEYDRELTEARARMAAASKPAQATATTAPVSSPALCADCGRVMEVSVTEKSGEGGPLGMIAGGAAGALLGRQIGSGTGKDLATIAGAVGGAYAGKKIEEKVKTHKVWSVGVDFADGSKGRFEFAQDPGFKVGDTIKKSGETVVR
jgi:uncharacterized protein YcfJ